MQRHKGEHFKYVVVTFTESETSPEMAYNEAEKLKAELDKTNLDNIHRISAISVPLVEE